MLKHPIYATAALLLCLLLPALPAAAQFSIQHSATPLVGKKGAFGVFKKAPKICIPAPQERLDSAMSKLGDYQYGASIPIKTNITMENSGKWKTTKTHRVWILEIEATGADMLTVLFDTIYLPENATLCYYTTDKKHLAYPSIINLNRIAAKGRGINLPALNNSGTSSSIIIEYREPIEVNEKKIFVINKIIYEKFKITYKIKKTSFRDVEDTTCEVDINCPSGVCWHNEGMGVASIDLFHNRFI